MSNPLDKTLVRLYLRTLPAELRKTAGDVPGTLQEPIFEFFGASRGDLKKHSFSDVDKNGAKGWHNQPLGAPGPKIDSKTSAAPAGCRAC